MEIVPSIESSWKSWNWEIVANREPRLLPVSPACNNFLYPIKSWQNNYKN